MEEEIPCKKPKLGPYCIIHCSDDKGDLVSPNNLQSWKTLQHAGKIRNHEGIQALQVDSDDEIPEGIYYHRKCRSIFTMKRDLERIQAQQKSNSDANKDGKELLTVTEERRSSDRQQMGSSSSRVLEKECIFCRKKDKYVKGENTREALTQARQLRTDETLKKCAEAKQDSRIIGLLTRDVVAAEAHWHRSCYRQYTKIGKGSCNDVESDVNSETYVEAENVVFKKISTYIRSEMFANNIVMKLSQLQEMFKKWMAEEGEDTVRPTTIKNLKRKLASEFGDSLCMVSESRTILVYPDSLTRDELVVSNYKLQMEVATLRAFQCNTKESVNQAATVIHKTVKEHCTKQEWPPDPDAIDQDHINAPPLVLSFLTNLLNGGDSNLSDKTTWLVSSIAQDVMYGITRGRYKPPKHILLPSAVKSLTGSVEIIQILNRLGHGVSYSQLEELDTSLCLQKLAMFDQDGVPLPRNIQPYVGTVLGFDNIDRIEETLSGGGTSHRVNAIAIQPLTHGPFHERILPKVDKNKQRGFKVEDEGLPIYNAGKRVGPAARKTIEVNGDDILQEARKKNLLYVLARLHYESIESTQKVSSWTGFNILVHDTDSIVGSTVGYLPTINAPATEMSTIKEVLDRSLTIMNNLHLSSITCVFDLSIYCKALEIKCKNANLYKPVVLRLGTFHTLCTLLSIIGKRFQDAGLKDLCIESLVIAEGSVSAVMEGRNYNRAIRFHKLAYEAFMRIIWDGFTQWLEARKCENETNQVEVALDGVGDLADNINMLNHDNVMKSFFFQELNRLFSEYVNHLRHSNGQLSSFWISYIDLVELLLHMIRASREGDWLMHLSCIREMLPWCFAYDAINYARYMSVYYSDMICLKDDHPEVYEFMKAGGFSVQMNSSNPFGRVPVDQTVEETVNKDTQTPGGTKGFSLKPGAVQRYYITAEFRTLFLRHMREMVGYARGNQGHSDLQQSRISKDEQDVKALVDLIKNNWTNPFESAQQICCISTGAVAPPDVASDLVQASKVGKLAYEAFKKERLESSKVHFHDKLKKQKLKTFTNISKVKKVQKGQGKEIVLRADRNLFARMIIIAECRKLQMQEVLKHPLGPIPAALANNDGMPRKTNKSQLGRQLEKMVDHEVRIPKPSAYIIDGMALVQKLKVDYLSFGEIADIALTKVLREGQESSRIDVVFDEYRDLSIKSMEREHRGEINSIVFKNLATGHKIKQFRNFLKNGSNKNSLIKFFVEHWSTDASREKLQDKDLYVTSGNNCFKLTRDSVINVEELHSTQEEADTRIILHAKHAAQNHKSVIVASEDTDVRILCLAFSSSIQAPIFQRCVAQSQSRYIDISKIASAIGHDVCKALPGIHAFTGCDSVSAFAGVGKVKPLKMLMAIREYQFTFQQLGAEWSVSPELFKKIESFVCALYCTKKETDVNHCRYALFCAKKAEAESHQLPPCKDCLFKHTQRANYQAAVWCNALTNLDPPKPIGKGWLLEEDESGQRLGIDWMSGPPAPRAVIEQMSCTCKKSCKIETCECIQNGLKCTDLCLLSTCTNQPDEWEDVLIQDDGDDEIEGPL